MRFRLRNTQTKGLVIVTTIRRCRLYQCVCACASIIHTIWSPDSVHGSCSVQAQTNTHPLDFTFRWINANIIIAPEGILASWAADMYDRARARATSGRMRGRAHTQAAACGSHIDWLGGFYEFAFRHFVRSAQTHRANPAACSHIAGGCMCVLFRACRTNVFITIQWASEWTVWSLMCSIMSWVSVYWGPQASRYDSTWFHRVERVQWMWR